MNFIVPNYFNYFKFLLVDELALCNNPALIHYGKCSVIGYLSKGDCISSLTIPNLQKCHQLPDCSFNVRLVMDYYPSKLLNLTVEIFGEVRLFDPTRDKLELESSHSLINKLRNLQTRLEHERGLPERPPSGTNDKGLHYAVKSQLLKEIEEHKERFKPIIQVYTIRHVREAKELIAENLHFRQIQNYRKSRLRLRLK